jgi:threonylcarbamoyladenosine tRNA methylthiotransferase MtaB
MDPLKFQIHTFGCKVNTYDSGLLQKNMTNHGNVLLSRAAAKELGSDPRVHVLNTCAVTAEATKEAIKIIRRIKAKSPLSTIVVTGCGAQVDTELFQNLPGADLVVANSHKGLLPEILSQYFKGNLKERVFKSNIFKKDDLEGEGGEESHHTRNFIKIQDGCNSFCTFCVIPYARGKSRSIPASELVKKINQMESQGAKEIVLTGVHIGDYEDGTQGLEALIEEILQKTKIPRIRLTSLEPIELSPRLLNLYRDPRMVPHFHLSIQSAATEVLREMKRKYGQPEVIDSLTQIQQVVPGAFVGMDVIAGFPTETEEQFNETYEALANAPWTRLHVFPYSERKGTRAAQLDVSVPLKVRAERAQRLRELSLHRYQSVALQQKGKVKKVLVQKSLSKGGHGLSEDYWNIRIANFEPAAFANQIVDVVVEDLELGPFMEGPLRGRLLQGGLTL